LGEQYRSLSSLLCMEHWKDEMPTNRVQKNTAP
jgi:hypothetical protein